ncbi:capsule biosynthesis protein [Pelagerythrobacter sp.]|uniref:capsule biosynthesis protein n=1 Tax=Pelagerythrobacter sp. TaxID=2800702 RepID=UPI0035B1E39A
MQYESTLSRLAERTDRLARVKDWLGRWRWFALFVILPSLLATVYYGLIASDVYVSESRFVIKAPDSRSQSPSALSSLIQSTGLGSGAQQNNEILGYIRSRDGLRDLSRRVDVAAAYSVPEADIFSQYPQPFEARTFENLYQYYGDRVAAEPDAQTGLTVLTVEAFRPEDAQALNAGLLALSEQLVNRLNERINSEAITDAEERVKVAQDRVRDARIQLSDYRNRFEILDPQQQGMGVLSVSNELISQEAALRAKLVEVERTAPNHPSLPALRERASALARQVAEQTGRAVGTPSGLASRMSGYEGLLAEQEFASQMLMAANATLEQARNEALQQQYYLARVVEPNRPDDAILPARLTNILAVVFVCLCLYLVGWMLVVGILEHAPDD